MADMKFRLSSEFGALEEVRNGRFHTGIDLAMPKGTELRSISDGVVERVVDYGSQNIGKGVIIKTDEGTRHIFGHMSDIDVKPGDKVNVGDLLGESGNSGHSTGSHLHFGIKDGNEWIDPTPLAERLSDISGKVEVPWWDVKGRAKQEAYETTQAWLEGGFDAITDVLSDLVYSVTLIGGGILIILSVAGWKSAKVYASILFIAYVLLRYLTGGI